MYSLLSCPMFRSSNAMTYDEPVSISFYLPALQHAQSYLQSSSASDDSLAPLPNSFTEGVDGDGDAEPDSSPRLGKRPQQPEPTSSIDDLRSGAFVYVKEPKGDRDLDNFLRRPSQFCFFFTTTDRRSDTEMSQIMMA